MTDWRPLAGKAARYLVTGGTAALVDIGCFTLALEAGIAIVPAATLSFMVGAVVNYWLSARFVFRQKRSLRGYLLFVAVATLGLILNVTLTALIAAHTPVPPVLAKVIAIAIGFVFNFTLNVLVVFRARDGDAASI
ncbi:GtrA family protein [Glacieibacterium frigidum]|uniref:GtrA family protein n=1 Tax=Glacieibacterium frigidum TaxID=2593303 RepID=UPI00163DA517|nr:GtrA family protein [Glacieibacterium frigidum]